MRKPLDMIEREQSLVLELFPHTIYRDLSSFGFGSVFNISHVRKELYSSFPIFPSSRKFVNSLGLYNGFATSYQSIEELYAILVYTNKFNKGFNSNWYQDSFSRYRNPDCLILMIQGYTSWYDIAFTGVSLFGPNLEDEIICKKMVRLDAAKMYVAYAAQFLKPTRTTPISCSADQTYWEVGSERFKDIYSAMLVAQGTYTET